MSSIQEKWKHKERRWIKEEYNPLREKYWIWIFVAGIIIALGIPMAILYVTKEVSLVSYLAFIIGAVLIILGLYMVVTSYKVIITLREIVQNNLVCYEYEDKDTQKKRVFESISGAELTIEDPAGVLNEP